MKNEFKNAFLCNRRGLLILYVYNYLQIHVEINDMTLSSNLM